MSNNEEEKKPNENQKMINVESDEEDAEHKEEDKNKNEKVEKKMMLVDDDDDEEPNNKINPKENNIKNKESDSPYYSDINKKVFKIPSSPLISEISILNTKHNPPNRCYITADYSLNNNSIICIGGSDEKCNQYNKITEYDLSKNEWSFWQSEDQTLGLELSGHSSNLVFLNKEGKKEEKIFVFGGYDNWKNEFTAQSYLIDIEMKNYEKINYNMTFGNNNNELPLPRTYHSSNYDKENDVIYIYGGTDMNINHCREENFQALWKFNLIEKTWHKIKLEKPLLDGPPRGHTSILLNNKLYIFGGVFLFKKFQNTMYIIDLKKETINKIDYNNDSFKKGSIPEPLAFHSAVLLDENRFLAHGGLNKYYNAINTCYIYYIKEMKFDKIAIPLIPNLFGHKMVTNKDKNKLYIIGGMQSFQYVGDPSLIEQSEEDENKLFNKNEGKADFFPMLNILEITLSVNNMQGESYGGETEPEINMKDFENSNKRIKWKKLFYVNVNEIK